MQNSSLPKKPTIPVGSNMDTDNISDSNLSMSFVQPREQTVKIADGIIYTKRMWDPDSDTLVDEIEIHMVEIDSGVSIDVTRSEDRMQTTSDFANAYGCVAAINGGYFWNLESAGEKYCEPKGHTWGGSSNPNGYFKGQQWKTDVVNTRTPANSSYYFATYGGTPFFDVDTDSTVDSEPVAPDLVLAAISHPVVINGAQAYDHAYGLKHDAHRAMTAQRTSIAETYHNTVLLVVATSEHGRNQCLTREQMSYFMANVLMNGEKHSQGVKNALELDGGGSSTMYIQGKGVVTPLYDPPSKTSPGGERIVVNHVGIGCVRTGRMKRFISPFASTKCSAAGE